MCNFTICVISVCPSRTHNWNKKFIIIIIIIYQQVLKILAFCRTLIVVVLIIDNAFLYKRFNFDLNGPVYLFTNTYISFNTSQ